MSASASKKKRKELEEQGLSARSVAAKKEKEKKKKTLRSILAIALAVIVCAAAVIGVIKLVNRPDYDVDAPVVIVGDEKISVPVYDYFYSLNASNFYNQYQSYSFIVQPNLPVSEQQNFFGEGTLEDYLKENTKDSLRAILNVVAKARKDDSFQLSDQQKSDIDTTIKSLESEAAAYGFSNADKYLRERFGEGCDLDTYKEYLELMTIYNAYVAQLNEKFQPTSDELREAYEKDPSAFDLVSFTYATSAAEASAEEPTGEAKADTPATEPASTNAATEPASTNAATEPAATNAATEPATTTAATEPATTTAPTEAATEPASTEPVYTEEAKAAAKKQAEDYAEQMPEDASNVTYTKSDVTTYLSKEIADWLFDDARKDGDVKVFARDEKETYFYTVRFDSRDTNDYGLVNANVISIAKDTDDAELKEGEQTAVEKKDALLAAVKDGMTDDEFSNAVTGLGYTANSTSISHTSYFEDIRTFLFDENRKAGDLFAYEGDTAYYVVRYVSTDEQTYRDKLVREDLWNKEYESISTANEIVIDEDLLQHANTNLTFYNNTSSAS